MPSRTRNTPRKRGRPPGSKNKPKPPPSPEELLEKTEAILEDAVDITIPTSTTKMRELIRSSPYGVRPETCEKISKSVALRAAGHTWNEVADTLCENRSTVSHLWTDHPEEVARQKAILAKRVIDGIHDTVILVQSNLADAAMDMVGVLSELATSKDVSPTVRKQAAVDIINLAFSGSAPQWGGKSHIKKEANTNFVQINMRNAEAKEKFIDVKAEVIDEANSSDSD